MLPEFGQSPPRLELDLDSYEGSWTHVSAFQGLSGWLMLARATIQSEHDLLRATLIAACDDHDNPIPSWRAEHLAECRWDRLDHCYEEPPEILDDLLCEEEGAFYARWQREMNSELTALYEHAKRNIEALEAKATARARQVDLQIADLRMRRRMAEASIDARAVLTEIIVQLEMGQDEAIAQLTEQRAVLRRQADATEEALWQRADVLIEVEPICLIRWRAKGRDKAERLLLPQYGGSGGTSLLRIQSEERRELEQRRVEEALEQARQDDEARAKALAKQAENAKDGKLSPPPSTAAKPKKVFDTSDLPKASPFLRKLAAGAATQPSAPPSSPAPSCHPPVATKAPVRLAYGKLDIERDMLAAMLEQLEEKGQKFFPGSRKFLRNQEENDDLKRRIAALDVAIARNGALPAFNGVEPLPNLPPQR